MLAKLRIELVPMRLLNVRGLYDSKYPCNEQEGELDSKNISHTFTFYLPYSIAIELLTHD